jgi:hypothetical protein
MGQHSHLRLVVSNYHIEEEKEQSQVFELAKKAATFVAYAAFFPSIYFVGTVLVSLFS